MRNLDWYNTLISPSLSPPSYIFALVWAILYVLIFISLIIYISKKAPNKGLGYFYFSIQMFLNFLWTPVFFGFKNILLALVIVVFMNIFLYMTIKKFMSVSKIASILLLPYFLWILFACYLNLGYLILNNK